MKRVTRSVYEIARSTFRAGLVIGMIVGAVLTYLILRAL